MDGYKDFKKQLKRKEQKLAKANEQTEKIDNSSKQAGGTMLENLPTPNKSLKQLEKEKNKSLKKK